MHAIILSIGDELVLGQTVDTNSAWLSAQLVTRGFGTLYHQTVADDRAAIAEAFTLAAQRAPLVIASGGLGPTDDDLTRQALADALGVDLVLDETSLEAIRQMIERRGRVMAAKNRVQAYHPRGTRMIPNCCGTAPGIEARLHNASIYVTPGVPKELFVMFEQSIVPALATLAPSHDVILTTKINTFGMGESTVGQVLDELMDRRRNPLVGTTVSGGIVAVRIRSEHADPTIAADALEQTVELVKQRLGAAVFGRDEQTLADAVVALLSDRKLTVATAESCTGGLLGAMITDISGSSAVYQGGWVTYANAMKAEQLDVPSALLQQHGAVSAPVAEAMAEAARHKSGADFALATTGVAGPTGGSADKPVGTVWIALAPRDKKTVSRCFLFPGDRETVRDRAAKSALQMLRLAVLGEPMDRLLWALPVQATV